jgi:hypothetical protein
MPRAVRPPPPLPTPAREVFIRALADVRGQTPGGTFPAIEGVFLAAMQEFDRMVVDGTANQGDIQNGKGDFFNDVLALLLGQCSEKTLHTRPNVPGLSFRNHKLDVAYPASGEVLLTIETKATGVPKHGRNTRQPHPEGRAGSADLDKRIKEAAFKNIDLKAEAARRAGRGAGPTSNLQSFLRSTFPRCYMFLSVRVRDAADLTQTNKFGHIADVWFDGCGLFCYGWNHSKTHYERKPIPDAKLELDRVLSTVCTELRSLP